MNIYKKKIKTLENEIIKDIIKNKSFDVNKKLQKSTTLIYYIVDYYKVKAKMYIGLIAFSVIFLVISVFLNELLLFVSFVFLGFNIGSLFYIYDFINYLENLKGYIESNNKSD